MSNYQNQLARQIAAELIQKTASESSAVLEGLYMQDPELTEKIAANMFQTYMDVMGGKNVENARNAVKGADFDASKMKKMYNDMLNNARGYTEDELAIAKAQNFFSARDSALAEELLAAERARRLKYQGATVAGAAGLAGAGILGAAAMNDLANAKVASELIGHEKLAGNPLRNYFDVMGGKGVRNADQALTDYLTSGKFEKAHANRDQMTAEFNKYLDEAAARRRATPFTPAEHREHVKNLSEYGDLNRLYEDDVNAAIGEGQDLTRALQEERNRRKMYAMNTGFAGAGAGVLGAAGLVDFANAKEASYQDALAEKIAGDMIERLAKGFSRNKR